ncbi:Nitroreductase-like protein, partial [Aspergillus keveii]
MIYKRFFKEGDVILFSLSYLVYRWIYLVSRYIKAPFESVESIAINRIPKREHQTKQEFQNHIMGSHEEPLPTLPEMISNRYKDTIPLDLELDDSLVPSQLATLSTILTHRTIRTFHSTPLPASTLPTLLACAQSASTSSMLQTYSILAIRDTAHKAAVAQLSGNQSFLHTAPLFLIFCADLHRMSGLATKYNQAGKPLENLDMLLTATIDASIAGQNVAIAAEALGLGICYVGGVRNCAAELTALLRLPPRVFSLFGIAVGYADSSV